MKSREISAGELRKTIEAMKKKGYDRVNSISGVDTGEFIEVVYHISKSQKDIHTLVVKVPKKKPEIETIHDILPGAVLLERELSEMLGVNVMGNDFDRLFLPENWPKGKYPLRKEGTENA